MGQISTVEYLGGLRTKAIHLESGSEIYTDAPKDNEGRGELFAPTDLVATALASCMITIMGIMARRHGFDIKSTRAEIEKEMDNSPRRISAVRIHIHFPQNYTDKEKKLLERTAYTCPVGKSLSNELEEEITFHYPNS